MDDGSLRRLGLLGGMSWESSVEYERIINRRVQEHLGGVASADLIIQSFNFAEIERLQATGDWHAAGELLADAAADLERAGAQAIVICTNTMHRLEPQIAARVGVPVLHIADATAAAVTQAGLHTVALLGTRYTMEHDFYRGRLIDVHGLDVLVPDEPDRTVVHDVIYNELVRGVISPTSREAYLEIIDRLMARRAGCDRRMHRDRAPRHRRRRHHPLLPDGPPPRRSSRSIRPRHLTGRCAAFGPR